MTGYTMICRRPDVHVALRPVSREILSGNKCIPTTPTYVTTYVSHYLRTKYIPLTNTFPIMLLNLV